MKKQYNLIIFPKKKFIPLKTKSKVKTTNSWNHMSITNYSKFIQKLNSPLLSNSRSFQNLNFIYNSYNENIYFFFCSTIFNMKHLSIKKVNFVKINMLLHGIKSIILQKFKNYIFFYSRANKKKKFTNYLFIFVIFLLYQPYLQNCNILIISFFVTFFIKITKNRKLFKNFKFTCSAKY